MANIKRKYSFPNVSINEKIVGPDQFISSWRNMIGVAAPFSRGPLLATITSRQELVALFGEDRSLGSTFVRQAILQGATNFTISRVLPTPKPARSAISFQSVAPLSSPAIVGNGDRRTIGIKLDFSAIGNPVITGPYAVFVDGSGNPVEEIKTNTTDFLEDLDFEGIGYLNFYTHSYDEVRGEADQQSYIVPTTGYTVASSSITNGITAGVKLITFNKNAVGAPKFSKLYPGCRLSYDNPNPAPPVGQEYLPAGVVKSHAFTLDNDPEKWGVFVELTSTIADVGNTSLKVVPPVMTSTSDWGRVITVSFNGYAGSVLPNAVYLKEDGRDVKSLEIMTRANQESKESILGYLFISDSQLASGSTADRKFPITYIKLDELGNYSLEETGVEVTFPKGNIIPNRSFSVSIMKDSIVLGESEEGEHDSTRAFRPGINVSVILNSLKDALYSNPTLSDIIDNVDVSINQLPYSLNYTTNNVGIYGNNILYKVTRVLGGIAPVNPAPGDENGEDVKDLRFMDGDTPLHNGTVQAFIGGENGTTTADLVIYAADALNTPLVYIRAISPGVFGNNISISIKRINKGRFDLEVQEILPSGTNRTSLANEVYTLSNYSIDTASGLYPETLDSKMIRAYFIPLLDLEGEEIPLEILDLSPARIAPIIRDGEANLSSTSKLNVNYIGESRLTNVRLSGGSEPAEVNDFISEQSYIEAIERLEEEDVAFISAPGLVAGDVRYTQAISTLISQAENSTTANGLRIAVLAAPPRLTKSRAELISREYGSSRLVIVGGWTNLSSERSVSVRPVGPEGVYLGRLSTEDTYISPASSYSGKSLFGIRSVDTRGDLDSLETYTINNIEMLFFDKPTNSIKFLNGRTSAKDLNNRWVSIRRQSDHLIMTLFANLQWARSSPNNSEIRARVAAACDAILKSELRRGAISGANPTVINSSDPLRIAQGYMDIIIEWSPVFPADYIDVNITRSISSSFSLFVG